MSEDIVAWISADPTIAVGPDGLEFTLTSKRHTQSFLMSRARARKAATAVLFLLDEEERSGDNVRPFKRGADKH